MRQTQNQNMMMMNNNNNAQLNGNISSSSFNDDEDPPLLEELGIRPDHMIKKTMSVLLPFKSIPQDIAEDSDMAGPVAICLALGFLLILSSGGELHFSAIYSFFLFGSLGIYMVLNLMAQAKSIDIFGVCSVLGYCLLPIVCLAAFAVVFNFHDDSDSERNMRWFPSLIAFLCVVWSTVMSTRFFEAGLKCRQQRYLIAYPVFLLYSCFALITVF